MPQLQEYTETLLFVRYPGIRVLLPDDLDLAIQRLEIRRIEDELERLEEMGDPAEISNTRRKLSELEGTELELAKAKIFAHESRRVADQEARLTELWRVQKVLEKMERLCESSGDLGGDPEPVRYELREFSKGDRNEVDAKYEVVHDLADGRKVRVIERVGDRNLDLLRKCLIGQWTEVSETRISEQSAPQQGFGGEAFFLLPIEEVADLQDTVAETLINRMWAKNTMAPELAGFFGKAPPPSRLSTPSRKS